MLFEYRIDSVLGQGGFGITYLARDTLLDEAVAIKEYFPNEHAVRTPDLSARAKSTQDQEAFRGGLDAFLDEARIIARFRHPNIMQVRRFFEAHGTGYIVLQFERGRSFEDVIARAPLPEAEILPILSGILNGLSVVHEQAILHRDLKPRNVIIRDDGSPVLIDFGAARDFRVRNSRSVTRIASPGYSPPEQYGVGNQQGPWTDFYALGAMLYRAVTGKVPVDSLRRLRDDPLVPAVRAATGRYSTGLLRAIDGMLQIDEHKRPAAALDIRKGVPALAMTSSTGQAERHRERGASPDAASHSWSEGESRKARSGKPLLWLGLAVIALLLIGIGSFLVFNRSGEVSAPPEVATLKPAEKTPPAEVPKASLPPPPAAEQPKPTTDNKARPIAPPVAVAPTAPPVEAPKASAPPPPAAEQLKATANNKASPILPPAAVVPATPPVEAPKKAEEQALLPDLTRTPSPTAPATVEPKQTAGDKVGPPPLPQPGPAVPAPAQTPTPAEVATTAAKPTARQAAKASDKTLQDCPTCPELVVIPAGSFEMGSNDGRASERPPHRVQIPKPFAMGRYEVTFAEWDACVAAGGCKYRPSDNGWGRGDRPVINLSWVDATTYVAWLSQSTGQHYRLPSEAEWEYADRAGTKTPFWFGTEVGPDRANCSNCGKEPTSMTQPVGSFPANAFGLFDTAGNVAEWVEDCWTQSYAGAPKDGSANMAGDCGKHVLRGGSFGNDFTYLRSAARFFYDAGVPYYTNGLRVARDIP